MLRRWRAAGGGAADPGRISGSDDGDEDEDGSDPADALENVAAGRKRGPKLARSLFGGGSDVSMDGDEGSLSDEEPSLKTATMPGLSRQEALDLQQEQLSRAFAVFRRAASHIQRLYSSAKKA